MSTTRDVAVFVGSLRKESFNRKLANALIAMAPAPLKLEIVEIRQLPLYNQDDDANPPAASAAFKERVQKADAVLFVTPEYNRSVPGVLKNAIDIALATLRQERLGRQARRGDQCLSGRDWRLRRQPSPAPVAGVPECPGDAAAGGLYRQCSQALR